MNTADLHPKRFSISLTAGQLRALAEELLAMEHAPHEAQVSAGKQLLRDQAGEQLATHVAMLVEDTRRLPDDTRVTNSVPLLRAAAKYLYTACDRCRRVALRRGLRAHEQGLGAEKETALGDARTWDEMMRRLGEGHGLTSPLRELLQPLGLLQEDLERLGLNRGTLLNQDELLAQA